MTTINIWCVMLAWLPGWLAGWLPAYQPACRPWLVSSLLFPVARHSPSSSTAITATFNLHCHYSTAITATFNRN